MSQENVEIVRASYEAFARGDFQASLEAYDPDCELDDTRFRPDGRVRCGREAFSDHIARWRGAFDEYEWTTERLLDAGEETVIIYTERGRGKGSGVSVEDTRGNVVTVRGGKIVRTVIYPTVATALKAVGLSE